MFFGVCCHMVLKTSGDVVFYLAFPEGLLTNLEIKATEGVQFIPPMFLFLFFWGVSTKVGF